jgi:hypothetical protein
MSKKSSTFARKIDNSTFGGTIMATAIKAIPTLYGEEATRFRQMAEEAERRYESAPARDRKGDPYVFLMRNMLQRSGMSVAL